MNKRPGEVLAIDHERLRDCAERFGLDLIVLFGSHAKGRAHENSDVDLGVWFERPARSQRGEKLAHEREIRRVLARGVVGTDAKLHVVVLNRVDGVLLRSIVEQGVPLYTRAGKTWPLFRMYGNRRYRSEAPYRERMTRCLRVKYVDRQR